MEIVKVISTCRYYSGGTECPFKTEELSRYWDLERSWTLNARGELDKENDELYRAVKGKNFPGIPRGLLIWMFTAYMKGSSDIKQSLPKFYGFIDGYLQAASDHFPPGEIPHNIK